MKIFVDDYQDAIRNQYTVLEGDGVTYPCVLSVEFSGEDTTEPVTSTEVKTWCAIDGSDFDSLITLLIKDARRRIERYTNRSLITRDIEAVVYPGTKLPYTTGTRYNINSVADEDGNNTNEDYEDLTGMDKYTISYTITEVDQNVNDMKVGICQLVGYLYDNRGSEMKDLPALMKSLFGGMRAI